MRNFAFSLAKELGKTVGQLGKEMGAQEFFEWMAWESVNNNQEYKDKLIKQIALEKSAKQSEQERADEISRMFKSLMGQ